MFAYTGEPCQEKIEQRGNPSVFEKNTFSARLRSIKADKGLAIRGTRLDAGLALTGNTVGNHRNIGLIRHLSDVIRIYLR
jgi:hypothetical protein